MGAPGAARVMGFSREKYKKRNKLELYLLTRAITRYIIAIDQPRGVIRMKANEILKVLMEAKNMSKAALGRAVGISDEKNKSQPTDTINKRLKQKNISIDMVADMVDKMDYQVVIVPKGVTVKSDWYRVDGEDNE